MIRILDRMARASGRFRPKTAGEFFALQLARKLKDAENFQTYLILAERHPEELLLQAYRHALCHGQKSFLAQRFREKLTHLTNTDSHERD
jgi:hypothetical protein